MSGWMPRVNGNTPGLAQRGREIDPGEVVRRAKRAGFGGRVHGVCVAILSETLACQMITASTRQGRRVVCGRRAENCSKMDGLLTPCRSALTMPFSLSQANPLQMNTFGARSLPAARSVQVRIGIRLRLPARRRMRRSRNG